MSLVSRLPAIATQFGFDHFGFTKLGRPFSMDLYRQWLKLGYQGEMDYLEAHADFKEDPRRLSARAASAIVFAKPYVPHPYPGDSPRFSGKLALYAQGTDYHVSFIDELEAVARELAKEFVNEEFLCFADSAPILERDLAYRAGLGWVGKNTCLIHPKRGSLFLLGEIFTSVDVLADATGSPPPATVPDLCGTCDRCVRACPTGALSERRLNANLCISHWTIEAKTASPEALRPKFGSWFFGCDVCQTVCPWNEKHHGQGLLKSLAERQAPRPDRVRDLEWILNVSHREIRRTFARTALSRARPLTLKRNALVVIANERLTELRDLVERLRLSPDLKEVADWTFARLT